MIAMLSLACVGVAGSATAQTAATSNIEGLVTDTTGGVLPGATVLVRNMDTNVTRELVTDESGRYRAAALQPGRYEVTATLNGFTARLVSNVEILVGQVVPVDLRLQPAGVTETVSVTAETPLVDTTRTDVSKVIGQGSIQNLPINGRRWDTFVLLSPGVSNDGNFGLVSYRGISGLYNNNMVDGVDNNQAFFSEARGRTRAVYSISSASIKEFQVGVSNMSAEFGRAAGGTVNAVTKSGTNALTGEGFYFLRDRAFQARDPFIPQNVWDGTDERRQQLGVAVGGPLRRDRVFFFGSYDQQLRSFPPYVNTSSATFYTTCNASPGNCAATTDFFRSLEVASDREANNKVSLVKIDWAANQSNQFSFSYNGQRWNSPSGIRTGAVLSDADSANGTDIVKTDFSVVNWNAIISQRWLNEFRMQIGRDYEEQTPNGVGPGTSVTGGIGFGMPDFLPRPKYPHERRYQFLDSVTFYRGDHTFKAGADFNFVQEELQNLFRGGGVYSYSNLTNIANDCPIGASGCIPSSTIRAYSNFQQAFDLNNLAGALSFSEWTYAFYVQDNWRVSDRLSLNLGLRYDYQQLPQPGSVETEGVTFRGNPAVPQTMTLNQDTNNVAPRLGATYDIGGRHDTVLRASYGTFYGLTSNSAVANAITNNGINQASYFFTPTTAGAPSYPGVLSGPPTAGAGRPDVQFFSPDLGRPRVDSVDLAVERRLSADVTMTASYLYSRGQNLPYFRDTNLSPANSTVAYVLDGQGLGSFPLYRGARPNASFGRMTVMESSVDTSYHALVLEVRKRFTDGLLFDASYTLAKSEDNGQTSATFFASNQPFDAPNARTNDVDNELSTSNNDRRHRGVASFHYQPDYLWGIGVGGILTLETGLPITQQISGSLLAAVGSVVSSSTNGTGGSFVAPWVGFNTDRQPGRKTFDMRVSKEFRVGGTSRIQVLWEAFNVFNTVNYASFSNTAFDVVTSAYDAATNIATVTLRPNAGYLVPRSASSNFWGPRDMQLGVRYMW